MGPSTKQWEILLVEDNPVGIRLAQEAFKELQLNHRMQFVESGIAATNYLNRADTERPGVRPDVIILSSSNSASDVSAACRLNANCYTRKPLTVDRNFEVIENMSRFWMETVVLPDVPVGEIY